jgi:hypothetical protein
MPQQRLDNKHFAMKTLTRSVLVILLFALNFSSRGQVSSGSDGHDGVFNPTTNTVINMADHPDGVYHYSSVYIPNGVMVTFIANSNNSPVTWLIQGNCQIAGIVNVSANPNGNGTLPATVMQEPGPGGFAGGNGGTTASPGRGPGGGVGGGTTDGYLVGGNASFADAGSSAGFQAPAGRLYGNRFVFPLVGGSGGGGNYADCGGGGGGAILLVVSGALTLDGSIKANGAMGRYVSSSTPPDGGGGAGSGGAVRLVASRIAGSGFVSAIGGYVPQWNGYWGYLTASSAGNGWVRFDTLDNGFNGRCEGVFSQGYQPFLSQANERSGRLTITSIGGVPVSSSPSGQLAIPDAVLSAQQTSPVPVVVSCANLPLNTQIAVTVKPVNGSSVSAVCYNRSGTLQSSTASASVNIPRGGGLIYATAATTE